MSAGTQTKIYIELRERCEAQMQIAVCNGCDACGLRCVAGVPATRDEWETLKAHLAGLSEAEREAIRLVEAQGQDGGFGR